MELRIPFAASTYESSLATSLDSQVETYPLTPTGAAQDAGVREWTEAVHDSLDMDRRDSLGSSIASELLVTEDLEGCEESSLLAEVENVSVVTLPPSSASSIMTERSNSAQEAPDVRLTITNTSPALRIVRDVVQACLYQLRCDQLYQRIALVVLALLSLVRPSNDGTLLSPPEMPVDYVEIVPAADHRPSAPVPYVQPGTEAGDSVLPSTTTYVMLSIVGLYALIRIIRRSSTVAPPIVPAGRRGRSATNAKRTRPAAAPPTSRQDARLAKIAVDARTVVSKEEDLDPAVPQQMFNVCLLGGEKVGISSLLARQVFGDKVGLLPQQVDESYRQAYKKKGAPTVTLSLCNWHDTATRQTVGSHGLHVAVVIFALDDQASLVEAQQTVKQLQATGKETGQLKAIYLVANKSDLAETATIAQNVRLAATRRRATAFADDQALPLFECSARTGEGVKDLFRHIARRLREN